MKRDRLKISAGAIVLGAAIYFLLDLETTIALLVPVVIHELGHLAAMQALGLNAHALRITVKGMRLEYGGYASCAGQIAAAAAGPAAGIIYAFAASWLGNRYANDYLLLSAGISTVLTLFNLLPVLPLDGGRILHTLAYCATGRKFADKLLDISGFTVSVAMFALGAVLMWKGYGAGLEIAAIWLLLAQSGIVKREKVL